MIIRLEVLVASINRLNAELREKLEILRKELNEEKNNNFKLREKIDDITIKQKREADKFRSQIEELEKEWNSKVDSFSNLLTMYNELRVKSKNLEEEIEKIDALEGILSLIKGKYSRLLKRKQNLNICWPKN